MKTCVLWCSLIIGGNTADAVATLRSGRVEANPFMRGRVVPVKIATTAAELWLVSKLPPHKRKIAAVIIGGVGFSLAAWNSR